MDSDDAAGRAMRLRCGDDAAAHSPVPARLLARLFPHSYRARLVAVVLACVLSPALALLAWLLLVLGPARTVVLPGLLLGAVAMIAGTALAMFLVRALLHPLRRAVAALERYERHRQVPDWSPDAAANDETGNLLRGLHRCLSHMDATQRQLERHALEDPLTGVMNRRGCLDALRGSVAAAADRCGPFVLCMLDLDNLKTINDHRGHAAGDDALVSLVDSARQCCLGGNDWIGRWGGDEFLLGLHADPDIALDRVKLLIEVLARPSGASVTPVCVSAGTAAWEPGTDAGALYRQADAAMYQAKFGGGRQVVRHQATDAATHGGAVA